jgi:SAM-dependent methyltransferase
MLMTSNAASFVGNIPHHYDGGLGPVIFVDYAADMARRVGARPVSRVLETAVGTGIVSRQLRRSTFSLDRNFVRATSTIGGLRSVAVSCALAGKTSRSADALALPFPDGAFDAVVCQFGVMFFPDKAKSYQEVNRVLAPGGCYLFNVWDSHRYNPFGRIAHEVSGSFFPANPPQFYNVPFSYHQIDPIKESLIDAGFGDLQIAVVRLEKKIPNVESFARGLVYGNPLIDQIRERGGVDPDRVVGGVLEALHREFGADARMPLQAIVFSATKPR